MILFNRNTYSSNSEYWSQKRTQNGSIHYIILDVHVGGQRAQTFLSYVREFQTTSQAKTKWEVASPEWGGGGTESGQGSGWSRMFGMLACYFSQIFTGNGIREHSPLKIPRFKG